MPWGMRIELSVICAFAKTNRWNIIGNSLTLELFGIVLVHLTEADCSNDLKRTQILSEQLKSLILKLIAISSNDELQ